MATQTKLQRKLTPQAIPPNTWTLITYDTVIRDDDEMAVDMELITPHEDADFLWARNVSWDAFTVPAGDTRVRQFSARFIRDPYGIRDDTGTADQIDTPGRDWSTTVWPFWGKAGRPVGLEVWHDHHEPVNVTQAQFSATTWDY